MLLKVTNESHRSTRGLAAVPDPEAGIFLYVGENLPLIRKSSAREMGSNAPRRPACPVAGSRVTDTASIATTLSNLFIPFISSLTQVKARRHP